MFSVETIPSAHFTGQPPNSFYIHFSPPTTLQVLLHVISWQRSVGPEYAGGQFIHEFNTLFLVRVDREGKNKTLLMTFHLTAVDFLKPHFVLVWDQLSAPTPTSH